MEFCALASGSSGNCFYIGNNGKGILIDAGISAKQICERLDSIKRKPESIKAIFITHEHTDHIKGADVFSRSFDVPIFATKKTSEDCFLCSDEGKINFIKNNEEVNICGMRIEAFSKSHKAADPVSYHISNPSSDKKISVITDLGYACENVTERISDSDFLCIESNHDVQMLEEGPYPYFLKKWIKSNIGHLSNMQAGLCVLEHARNKLKNVILSHLSKTNNTPGIALKSFNSLLKERRDVSSRVIVSIREKPTQLIKI